MCHRRKLARRNQGAPVGWDGDTTVHEIDPLTDARWSGFLEKILVLRCFTRCHGSRHCVEPTGTGQSPIPLLPCTGSSKTLVFCRVESWLTGRRLVSLPFSDCCDSLVDDPSELRILMAGIERRTRLEKWRYFEMRPLESLETAGSNDAGVLYSGIRLSQARSFSGYRRSLPQFS